VSVSQKNKGTSRKNSGAFAAGSEGFSFVDIPHGISGSSVFSQASTSFENASASRVSNSGGGATGKNAQNATSTRGSQSCLGGSAAAESTGTSRRPQQKELSRFVSFKRKAVGGENTKEEQKQTRGDTVVMVRNIPYHWNSFAVMNALFANSAARRALMRVYKLHGLLAADAEKAADTARGFDDNAADSEEESRSFVPDFGRTEEIFGKASCSGTPVAVNIAIDGDGGRRRLVKGGDGGGDDGQTAGTGKGSDETMKLGERLLLLGSSQMISWQELRYLRDAQKAAGSEKDDKDDSATTSPDTLDLSFMDDLGGWVTGSWGGRGECKC